ncbi:cation diffusion facilitator family transporter [Thiomonas sp. FB-Cd]|uniref:cation diffusion facilitator family transporter n=1 Tax=Thiomonas sp. FB-Cd TaxID=1158292 RepID=UPI0004DF20CE|nr:cation diffusion facilitator family transporter [Thiomonas sp. FB-Cd]
MSHDRDHRHAAPQDFGARFAFGIALNIIFVAIEAFYGWRAGSLALLADAGHNLGDVGGLALAWAGLATGRLRANDRHTYGWQRGSVLASFFNATLLLVLMGALALEAASRLSSPAPVDEWPVLVVAAVGIAINGITAWLFLAGSKGDLNIRGAFLHMTADALVSLGVVIGAAVVLATGWLWIDPAISLLIVAVVVWGTWSLFAQSLHLLFDGVPHGVDLAAIRARLLALPGVLSLHDLHVWALSTSKVGLTAHLVVRDETPSADAILEQAEQLLHEAFEIKHVTLQLESPEFAAHCELADGEEPGCAGSEAARRTA